MLGDPVYSIYGAGQFCGRADIWTVGSVKLPIFFISFIAHAQVKLYSGRTKYSAFVSKLNKLSEEYLSPQKTQKAAVFFIGKILGRRLI
jgi:hypothetical protein